MNNSKTIEKRIRSIREQALKISNRKVRNTYELEKKLEANDRIQTILEELKFQMNREISENDLEEKISLMEEEIKKLR